VSPRWVAAGLGVTLAGGALSVALLQGGEQATVAAGTGGAGASASGTGVLGPLPQADCAQWRQASQDEREMMLRQLGSRFARSVEGTGGGYSLPLDAAHDSLSLACAQPYATAFKLWKVYEKALGFQYDRSVLGEG
jgi:hypothetical protein